MVAIADIGLRERLFDNLGLMGLELLESSEFFYEWNNFVEDIGKCSYMDPKSLFHNLWAISWPICTLAMKI